MVWLTFTLSASLVFVCAALLLFRARRQGRSLRGVGTRQVEWPRTPWVAVAIGTTAVVGVTIVVIMWLTVSLLLEGYGSGPPSPLASLAVPPSAEVGGSFEVRLTLRDASLRFHETPGRPLEVALERVTPAIVEAYLVGEGFAVKGGEPVRQRLAGFRGEWVWNVTVLERLEEGQYVLEARVFDSTDEPPAFLESTSEQIEIVSSQNTCWDRVVTFLGDEAPAIFSGLFVGTLLAVFSFFVNGKLRRSRQTE